ncbi:aldose 1-epimerase [Domibacillus enclensis]|uniref:Aldose 1-epimerase n=1 Tax=Domibacillus enclensis TaxID=1017273 RepID=A0A1N6Y9B5_9BACI|nr:aldose 1-epimerase [Domibacillus enclensis]OXS77559.1 aldose 1-epimerase [Domibacillus enclensis]SIR11059.1 aldose 1-epimerase [Domibacillus enclensis]
MIQHIQFDGAEAIQASNGALVMTIIPSFGSNVISLVDVKTGQELLVKPESFSALQESPILHGIPVLFPPNRIEGGTFSFEGETHEFPINEIGKHHIHGFVYDKPWRVVTEKEESGIITIETAIQLEEPAIYQHAVIHLTYELEGQVLRQKAVVKNEGSKPFPWGIGYHTALLFDERNAAFSLTKTNQWTLTDEAIPTGKLEETDPFEQVNLQNVPLDDAFAAAASENKAVVEGEDIRLVYRTDSAFKHWVVYNGNGREGFLCPEPYTCITNAFNLDLPADVTGLRVLQPGEEDSVTAQLEISYPQ